MEYEELLSRVGSEPVFETGFLLAGSGGAAAVHRQLSRWVRAGRLVQLRRGLYALAPPFRKVEPHPFLVSNRIFRGSYVSREAALAHHGLIPEAVPLVTAAGNGRPQTLETPLGAHDLRHLKPGLVRGFRTEEVARGQRAFVATPEKALLDLVYLTDGGDSRGFLMGLRLQHLETLDPLALGNAAAFFGGPKMSRAVRNLISLAREEQEDYGDT
jgi:hypothetical protein